MEWLFLVPALTIVVCLILFPVASSIVFSFNEVELGPGRIDLTPIGTDNYTRALFSDPTFWKAAQNTLSFVLGAVIFETTIGLGLALLVSAYPRLQRALTSILLIPLVMPPVVISLAWVTMYDFRAGVINSALRGLGLPPVLWLSSTSLAMPSVIIADIWHLTPFVFLIFLAGLQAMPVEPFEAAQIDGASPWQIFCDVTLPLLRPVLLVVMLLRTIDGARVFDKVFIMTGGGPGTSSVTAIMHIYRQAFRNLDFGYAAAMSVLMLLVLAVVAVIYVRFVLGRQGL
jgi:multiple sugar transport system permease protein